MSAKNSKTKAKAKAAKHKKDRFDPALGITLGAVALLAGGVVAALLHGRDSRGTGGQKPDGSNETGEHVPTDLMGDSHPDGSTRAVDAFRPDPTAPVPDAMRDALRPATGPAPSMVLDRGNMNNQTASANA